jgi:cysteine desulfurase/selenocysteine lyase
MAGAIGLGAALDYLSRLGITRIGDYEAQLLDHAQNALSALPGVTIVGTAAQKASVVSFLVEGIHPHDLGTILDQEGIAIRTGHHCAQPVMDFYGIPATARASLAFYNTHEEIDLLVQGLKRAFEVFGR